MIIFTIFITFLRLGCTSFGGPMAHLVYFRQEFVNRKKWFSESQYASIVSICQTLPGPASSQVGYTIGLLKGGWLGGITAFIAFTLPSVLLLILFAGALSWFASDAGQALIQGLMILAFVVVLQGVLGMGKQLCQTQASFAIAVLSFIVLVMFSHSFIHLMVIAGGAGLGFFFCRSQALNTEANTIQTTMGMKTTLVCSALFIVLLGGLPMLSGELAAQSTIFFQAGSMVFGGGHVVLPLLEDAVVQTNMISEQQFLAGYGATQALPGPMFAFAAYVGYLLPVDQEGITNAFTSAIVATMFIFLPGFLLVSAVLPIWTKLSSKTYFTYALAGANAAVVGLLAATLYQPIFLHAIVQPIDLAIAAIIFALISRWKCNILLALLVCLSLSMLRLI